MSLARMYQHVGGKEGAAAAAGALSRALAVCQQVSSGLGTPVPEGCSESFAYLTGRLERAEDVGQVAGQGNN